jgi:hypothetical protein
MLGVPTPTDADPTGDFYTFERGAERPDGEISPLTTVDCSTQSRILDRHRDAGVPAGPYHLAPLRSGDGLDHSFTF